MLNARDEVFIIPSLVNSIMYFFIIDLNILGVWEHSGRVVSPDDEVFDIFYFVIEFLSELVLASVVVEPGHGGETLLFESLLNCVSHGDEGISVGGVAHH